VYRLIAEAGGTGLAGNVREWAALLRENAPNDRARSFMTQLAVESPRWPTGEPSARYVDSVLARVGELAVSREIAAVKGKLQRINPVQQQAEHYRLFGDLVALEQRRKALIDRAAGL
jgi:DNA primase